MTQIPDLQALVDACHAGATLRDSPSHGDRHWRSVARAAVEIRRADAEPDGVVLLLFALLHDARRELETRDPQHGPRAAVLAEELRERGLFAIDDAQMSLLTEACRLHDTGVTSDDPTIGACYDADRVNLTRFGFDLDFARLSRPVVRDAAFIDRCRSFDGQPGEWNELAAELLSAPQHP